ncbi:MAG: tyrosine-type recombinase/integrase [Pirellulales bacterium]
MGGKLRVYRRPRSSYWQCSTFIAGKNWRISTKEDSLSRAKEIAEDWYLGLRGKARAGELKTGKTFAFAAEQFLREYEVITHGQRNQKYVDGHKDRLRVHLLPFFGPKTLAEITPGMVQDYRVHRATSRIDSKTGEPKRPARSTLHQEIVCLRQVLKTAHRHGWLQSLPDLSPPYKASGKISHRAWFSPQEYRQLYNATRQRANEPLSTRWRWQCEQLHDLVLFMANTGLRPDEVIRLEYRDVTVAKDHATGEVILEIEVRGKRGVGHCKSTRGAVGPFLRLRKRNKPQSTDPLFPSTHRELFNAILAELGLRFDREGNRRTLYSLRHTYICLRLMEGADIYQIAKNCRTSVEMIEKYYATHIKNTLNAAAINVRRAKPKPKRRRKQLI